MCGIAGFMCWSGSSADRLHHDALCMADALRHRGPDDAGTWVDASAGVALAHRRLSIIDLSEQGHQPMTSHSGRWVTVFNGEIYNYLDMRRELESQQVVFHGDSDTEVLLEYVDRHGVTAALTRADGMFAIALWDTRDQELVLARDRVGEKPLYYGVVGKTMFFGSELKAIRAHQHFSPEVDRSALAAYLRLSYVPSPHSIYRGIAKLPPGTSVVIKRSGVGRLPEPVPYWTFPISEPVLGRTRAELCDELDVLLRGAIASRMVADVPVGAFLSGGIDSSLVVALMQQVTSSPVRTFSIGFDDAAYDEAPYAAEVARHLGTEHEQLYVTSRQALDVVPRLSTIFDEPFGDSSQIPTYLVSEMTRRRVTVALSGDAGDELFGGYDRYRLHLALSTLLGRTPSSWRRAGARGVRRVQVGTWDRIGSGVNRALPRRRRVARLGDRAHKVAGLLDARTDGDTYLTQMSQWERPDEIVVGAAEAHHPLADPTRWIAGSPLAQVMHIDALTYLPDDILAKVDRAAMAVSLETRVPFLAPGVIDFAASVPDEHRRRGADGKLLLRSLLDRYVPRELVDRPKMGFGVPLGAWLRGPLRPWAEDLLTARSLVTEGLEPNLVRAAWQKHLSGHHDLKYPLWNVLMYLEWARTHTTATRGF